jgi:AraC-like DNA-binding protein
VLFEPSTIVSMLAVIGRTVERYGHDPKDLYKSIGVEADQMDLPGWRVPYRVMQRAWEEAYATTGDPCLGLRVAEQLRPGHLHVFGLAWMASSSVADAMRRLMRYQRILSTALAATFEESGDEYVLAVPLPEPVSAPDDPWPAAPIDAFFGTILTLCRMLAGEDFAPLCVEVQRSDFGAVEDYRKSFRGPVVFGAAGNAIRFRRADCDAPVVASARELAIEVDSIAERYLRSVDSSPIVAQLRSILVELLPSGAASQEAVAGRTHTSISTLQRLLRAEGTSYREVLDETRRELAQHYVKDGRYGLSEIAFLLGFADQASMTRAFKRWTGTSPKRYAERSGSSGA